MARPLVLVLGVTLVLSAGPLSSQSRDADAIRDRLDAYLLAYEPQLSSVVADEFMEQRQRSRQWVVNNRRIKSEVAFVALPGNAGWMGFRRVIEVNGKAVKASGETADHQSSKSSSRTAASAPSKTIRA